MDDCRFELNKANDKMYSKMPLNNDEAKQKNSTKILSELAQMELNKKLRCILYKSKTSFKLDKTDLNMNSKGFIDWCYVLGWN